MKPTTRSALLHHRHLCAVRVRQSQLHRHSDRRHRSAGAQPQIRSGAHGAESGGRGNHGEFHVGLHRGHAVVMHEAVAYIRDVTVREPHIAVVLGSGLGAFADELADPIAIPYSEIPGWPVSTAAGHAGKLVFGKLGKLDVAVMAGRAHLIRRLHAGASHVRRARAAPAGRALAWCSPMPRAGSICPTSKARWC